MDDKMSLYHKCSFPNCKKPWWIKLFSYFLGGRSPPAYAGLFKFCSVLNSRKLSVQNICFTNYNNEVCVLWCRAWKDVFGAIVSLKRRRCGINGIITSFKRTCESRCVYVSNKHFFEKKYRQFQLVPDVQGTVKGAYNRFRQYCSRYLHWLLLVQFQNVCNTVKHFYSRNFVLI